MFTAFDIQGLPITFRYEKYEVFGAGEMVQCLRALAVPEDPRTISSTHMAAHN